ncbi:hypothetical protein EJ03DRAFT_64701 [Teratosphaeria nubilosa]|uniref:Uncharacterized protein n=1 Tax=Teratosphaeria nubilosa TaxID=161662 RepID=A0A6G1LD52_9PEZI|nr:hypothetical protein EJ03DRAFT_64701 [Teratosphaeria nubilosa]
MQHLLSASHGPSDCDARSIFVCLVSIEAVTSAAECWSIFVCLVLIEVFKRFYSGRINCHASLDVVKPSMLLNILDLLSSAAPCPDATRSEADLML